MDIHQNINSFINDLLHIEDVKSNKLLNVYAGKGESTYILGKDNLPCFSAFLLKIIAERVGKPANVVLKESALNPKQEQIVGLDINALNWTNALGDKDTEFLHKKFIAEAYKDLSLKGTNPLYLTVGAINWVINIDKDEAKEICSPVLIFPIRLIRNDASNSPVYIEFINDEIYVNPCLIAKLRQIYGDSVADIFPHPNASVHDLSFPVEISDLSDGADYFARLSEFVNKCNSVKKDNDSTLFSLNKDFACILNYNHDEICMYYDIQKNKDKIYENQLIERIFNKKSASAPQPTQNLFPQYIMPRDSIQEGIIKRVVNGESMIIKGPPGTGKTLTITNMVASLLAENKKVLLCSKKLGALAEIHAKLPDALRKFTMLLDCESEAQASKLNPSEVRADFIALLKARENYAFNTSVSNDAYVANNSMLEASETLKKHKAYTFGTADILEKNYYDVLDMLCDKNVPPIQFTSPETAYRTPITTYNEIKSAVADGANAFRKITENAPINKCPFMPTSKSFKRVDTEKAFEKNSLICKTIESLNTALAPIFERLQLPFESMDIISLNQILSGNLSSATMQALLDVDFINNPFCAPAIDLLIEYKLQDFSATGIEVVDEKGLAPFDSLNKKLVDKDLTRSDFLLLNANYALLESLKGGAKLTLVLDQIKAFSDAMDKENSLQDDFFSIFSSSLTEEELAIVEKSIPALQKYFGLTVSTPKLLDLKAKSFVKKLTTFGYGESLDFSQMVEGAKLYSEIIKLRDKKQAIRVKISSLLKSKLTKDQLNAIIFALTRANKQNKSFDQYVTDFKEYSDAVLQIISSVSSQKDFTLQALISKCESHFITNELLATVSAIDKTANLSNVLDKAENIASAKIIIENKLLGEKENILTNLDELAKSGRAFKNMLQILINQFDAFKKECFDTYYTSVLSRPTFSDLKIFLTSATDRNVLGAVANYLHVLDKPFPMDLRRFFAPFENGLRDNTFTIEETFEHSVYNLAVQYKLSIMDTMERNGQGEKLTSAFDEFNRADKRAQELTIQNIEKLCMYRIDAKDTAFSFLNTAKTSGETLRLFFKKNAEGIIKLKKCFMLSPSTTSVLLTHPAFFNFDVVICDEASQLEPTALFPLIIRSKQLVLVGDEWQMPPIKRGVAKSEKRIDEGDGDFTVLSPDISALSLALTNEALGVAELSCHYRSKTEALISFSQSKYYPYMRTFPAIEPKSEGVGLTDIYIEDAICEGGENEKEAKQVISCLKAHFDKYYNQETGELFESIGVVGFGEKQIKLILQLINKEPELYSKIEHAKQTFADDAKEKLIFFKPIDKVQGQEINHLILSLTYGKNKNGKVVNSFGELNRGNSTDKLGQCIFNVAVTRAKKSVTVIHSIKPYEIDTPSVEYIKEYLLEVARFKGEGRAQFFGTDAKKASGFLKDVANTLIEAGISPERIVINYGGTNGSVRIPLVILNKELNKAVYALWCEVPTKNTYNYFDYNLKYYEILKDRGWSFTRVFIHDWFDNKQSEKQKIISAIQSLI